MKRLKREPLTHDAFGYLAELAKELEIPIHSAATIKRLGREIVNRVKQLTKNPAYLHGHRAEAAFEMIVASLDSVRLLKQEDSGRFYHSAEIEIGAPDYRLVLIDGRQILVEVKNETAVREHRHKEGYFKRMLAYAAEMNCDLYFAIYWVGWRQWTLVHAKHFSLVDGCYVAGVADAFGHNDMALIGDRHFATTAPLRLRTELQPLEVIDIGRGRTNQRAVIKTVRVYSDGKPITARAEVRMAMAFIFYGTWVESVSVETNAEGGITAQNFDFNPRAPDDGESAYKLNNGFDLIASLSGIITGQYNAKTTKGGKLQGVLPKFEPGAMKDFLPDNFFEDPERVLRLWSFTLQGAE